MMRCYVFEIRDNFQSMLRQVLLIYNIGFVFMFQFFRFFRRIEGIEVVRKYFLDVRKSLNCIFYVYVVYVMMVFCFDKDFKVV